MCKANLYLYLSSAGQQNQDFGQKVPNTFFNQQINLGLLVFSLVGFLLPGYLFYLRRQIIKEKAAFDSLSMSQSAQESNSLNQTNDSAKYQTNGNVWGGKHSGLRCLWIIHLIYEIWYHGTSETELLDFMFSHC